MSFVRRRKEKIRRDTFCKRGTFSTMVESSHFLEASLLIFTTTSWLSLLVELSAINREYR